VVSYLTDTLSRNSNITLNPTIDNAAWFYLQDCYKIEERYKQMLLDGKDKYANLDTFNVIEE
jgi:hypothetical protein